MKQIVLVLAMVSSVAGAQTSPFDFTVPFPDAKLQTNLRLTTGYGDALGAGQFAEVDLPVGSRVVVVATSNFAYQHFTGSIWGAGQVEAMIDAVRFAGWHLAVSAGARRHYDGSGIALGRLILSRTTATWSVAANADVTRAFSGPELETVTNLFYGSERFVHESPYRTQYFESIAATAKVASGVHLGAEALMAQGSQARSVFFGPLVSFGLPGSRARLDVSGGPFFCTAGDCSLAPDYTVVGRYDMPVLVHQIGYTLRLGVTVGL